MHRRSSAANRATVLYSMSGTSPASGLMLASFRIRVTAQTGSLCQPETHSLSDRLPFGWQTPRRRSLRRHRNPRTGPEKSAPAFSFQYFCYSCLSLPLPRQVLLVVVAMDRRGTCYSPFPASSSGGNPSFHVWHEVYFQRGRSALLCCHVRRPARQASRKATATKADRCRRLRPRRERRLANGIRPGRSAERESSDQDRSLAGKHAGVIAWSREANPALGEYGEPTILFRQATVTDGKTINVLALRPHQA